MRKIIPILMMALGLMAACSTLDCPLNNTVYTKYRLAGNITTLTDTLTISTNRIEGTDSADQQGRECGQFHTAHELLAVGRQPLL